jgi:hypothetical protein
MCRTRQAQEEAAPPVALYWTATNIPKYDLQKLEACPRLPTEVKHLIASR